LRIAPSESGASLSTYQWSENPGAGQVNDHIDNLRKRHLDKDEDAIVEFT